MVQKELGDVNQANKKLGIMQKPGKIEITTLNRLITCYLCKGYFIDATTITECLHTFCRSCIVKYLQLNKYCPVCDIQIHKTKPLLNIKPDKIKQDIVYKLVPRLFQNETERRKQYYSQNRDAMPSASDQKVEFAYQHILSSDETVCISLNYYGNKSTPRYLRCPAGVSVMHLQKLLRAKYDLSTKHRIDLIHDQDVLESNFTLIDIACIYLWRRKAPMELNYRIYEYSEKKREVNPIDETRNAQSTNNNDWKEVQLTISENGEMCVTGIQDCLDLLDQHCAAMDAAEASADKLKTTADSETSIEKTTNESEAQNSKSMVEPIKQDKQVHVSSVPVVAITDQLEKQNSQVKVKKELPALKLIKSPIKCSGSPDISKTVESSTPDRISKPTKPKVEVKEVIRIVSSNNTSIITLDPPSTISSASNKMPLNNLIPVSSTPSAQLTTNTTISKNSCKAPISTTRAYQSDLVVTQSADFSVAQTKKRKTDESQDEPAPKLVKMIENVSKALTITNGPNIDSCGTPTVSCIKAVSSNESFSTPISSSTKSTSQPTFINKNLNVTHTSRPGTPNPVRWPASKSSPSNSLQQPPVHVPCYKNAAAKPSMSYAPIINVPKVPSSVTPQAQLKSTQQPPKEKSKSKTGSSQMVYKTLKEPPKTWNPQIARKIVEPQPSDKNAKPAKFFKRSNNMPRYLGNPASGVKPLYKVHLSPDKDTKTVCLKTDKTEIKKHSIVKIDPKTLKPISEKAPDISSLTNQPDLKITTSSVSIFNPLKLQTTSPKCNDRKSPKSPHSPKKTVPSQAPPPVRDKPANASFTHTNPFISNLSSPTLDPNQFVLNPQTSSPSQFPYDPRYLAAYHSYFMPHLPFVPPTTRYKPTTPYVGIDQHLARSASTKTVSNQQILGLELSPTNGTLTNQTKKMGKDTKTDKSLQNTVEKLTQNKMKESKDEKLEKTVQDIPLELKNSEKGRKNKDDNVKQEKELVKTDDARSDKLSSGDNLDDKVSADRTNNCVDKIENKVDVSKKQEATEKVSKESSVKKDTTKTEIQKENIIANNNNNNIVNRVNTVDITPSSDN